MPPNANLARLAQRPILYGAGLRLQADGRTVMVPMHRELARGTLRSILRQADFVAGGTAYIRSCRWGLASGMMGPKWGRWHGRRGDWDAKYGFSLSGVGGFHGGSGRRPAWIGPIGGTGHGEWLAVRRHSE